MLRLPLVLPIATIYPNVCLSLISDICFLLLYLRLLCTPRRRALMLQAHVSIRRKRTIRPSSLPFNPRPPLFVPSIASFARQRRLCSPRRTTSTTFKIISTMTYFAFHGDVACSFLSCLSCLSCCHFFPHSNVFNVTVVFYDYNPNIRLNSIDTDFFFQYHSLVHVLS